MQRLQESKNGAILEYITNQQLAENHCALSAEDLGVRERVRRVRLNWTVHVPVSRSLQGNGAEKRDGGRLVEGALSAGVAGVRERDYFGIYYKLTTCRKPLCSECRGFGSQGTGTETEDSYELGGALSCQRKLTREWGREEGRCEVG